MEGSIYEGLFFATYDYGYGNELIPYIEQTATSVMAICCFAVILLWLISMAIASTKDEPPHVYLKFGIMLTVIGGIIGFFSMMLCRSAAVSATIIIVDIVAGGAFCVLMDRFDELAEEEHRREIRKEHRKMFRELRKKGGRV